MHDFRTTYPDTWNELVGGSLSVSNNGIPSTSVGADYACKHLNRQMKVQCNGISNDVNAMKMFLPAAPELSRMSVEYRRQLDSLIWKWSVRVKLRERTPR